MSAHQQLHTAFRALSARGGWSPRDSASGQTRDSGSGRVERLRFPGSPAARRAAVLILFGTLDDLPAGFHAGVVPDELDVLLVERAGSLSNHPGQVAFPGGVIDPADAGPEAAALREAVEETGLEPSGVEILGALPEVALQVSNFRVTPVLAWWSMPSPVAVMDRGESEHVFRVAVADLLNPGNRRTAVVSRNGTTHRSPAFLVHGMTVWGFTAMLLDGLFDELGWTLPWNVDAEIPPPL